MRFLVLILLFSLLVISQINTIVDSDLWCHFKTGEYIIKNFHVPQADIFSYTLKNQAWIDHEWLSQVLFYIVFAKFSWLGVNILKAIVISSCFLIFLFFIISKYKKFIHSPATRTNGGLSISPKEFQTSAQGSFIYAILFIVLSVLAFGYRSFARPEIFSYLLLCLFFYVLEDGRKLYILPLLQVLWVNLHGYFILGPIFIFLYCAGDLIHSPATETNGGLSIPPKEPRASARVGSISSDTVKAKKMGLIFFWTCLACFVNPYFYKGVFYPVRILASLFTEQKLYMRNIQELMMPVNVSFGRYIFFWILAILSSITFLVNLKKARMRHILIFLGAFMASYAAVRNLPVFIFIAMPLAVINLNEADLTKNIIEKKYYAAAILIILATAYFFASNRYYIFTKQAEFKNTGSKMTELLTPSKACDFLENNHIKGPIFNSIDFGHYISYRFYPEKRVFIDARTELYKYDFYRSYQRAQNYPGEWEALQKKYNFNIAFLRHIFSGTERILRYLYSSKEWALVYYDENSAIFLRDTPSNKKLIERFKVDFSKKKIEKSDEVLSTAGFFEKIGELKSAEDVYGRILKLNPEFLEAGNNLAAIYINTGRIDEALKIIDRFLKYYPESAELYCNKGTAYLRIGKKEKGLLMLERSARLNPYLRQASYMLGLVYLEKGDIDRAIKQFVKYLTLDPYNAAGHRILGDTYRQKRLLKKAAEEYAEADSLEGR